MARMHSRKKGKAGSTKPIKKTKSIWVRYSKEEVEQLILKLAKSGETKSNIGITLRDTYGVPDVRKLISKRIGLFLEEQKAEKELPDDLTDLIKREISIIKHIESHKQDETAKRGLHLTESKIRRLVKYYKRTNKLPAAWKYDREQAKLLIG